MIKQYASKIFTDWGNTVTEMFVSLVEKANNVVDLGCGDGEFSLRLAKKAHAKNIVGIDAFNMSKKIKVIQANLNKKLPLKKDEFDAVFSHFSLEHLYNTGVFISESHRILKKGGYTLVATDNMSSWANIIALLLGFQPFSTTSGIAKRAIGNPLALRSNFEDVIDTGVNKEWRKIGEYSHNKVLSYTYRALIEAYQEYGFIIEKTIGVGYLPFMGKLSRLLAKLDKRHAHLLILKARKI